MQQFPGTPTHSSSPCCRPLAPIKPHHQAIQQHAYSPAMLPSMPTHRNRIGRVDVCHGWVLQQLWVFTQAQHLAEEGDGLLREGRHKEGEQDGGQRQAVRSGGGITKTQREGRGGPAIQ